MADRDVPPINTPPFHVRLGQKVYRAVQEIGASARFLGQLEVALMKSLAHPKRMRLIALASSIQKAGFDALPLIAIMTFFIGAVVALIGRSEEHTSELQSLMRISYAVFCLKKKINNVIQH